MSVEPHSVVDAVSTALDGVSTTRGIVVGVSGGADSVALTRAISHARGQDSPSLLIAHLDHAIRPDSATDAEWVRQFADRLGLAAVLERRDVRQFADEAGVGIEEAARRCRYGFLTRVAMEQGCACVAVAHNADDQAETILHHLIRGTGLAGLRGIPESRRLEDVTLIRPLLRVRRDEILSYLASLDQPYLTDATNTDETHTRNRIRHTLLPLLREEFNPQVTDALLRVADQAQAAQDIVQQQAELLLKATVVECHANRIVLQTTALQTASRHLVREALRGLFARENWPRQRMSFDQWNRLADLAQTSQSPKSLSLADGVTAAYRRSTLTLTRL